MLIHRSYDSTVIGHYGYSGMVSERGRVLQQLRNLCHSIAEWTTKTRIIDTERKVSKDRRISNSTLRAKKSLNSSKIEEDMKHILKHLL